MRARSERILTAPVDVVDWNEALPPVDAIRPAHCPGCGIASRPAGAGLNLHGHGLRTRQLLGPLSPTGDPQALEVVVRRYRCLACGCVCNVAPRGVLPRKHYSGLAIALALTLWAHRALPSPKVHERVSPRRHVGATAARRWASLLRWSRGPPWPVDAGEGGPRARARSVVRWLLSRSPLSAATSAVEARVFAAAAQSL